MRSRNRRLVRTALATVLVAVLGLGTASSAGADDIDDRLAAAKANQQTMQGKRAQLEEDLHETDAKLTQAVLDLDTVEAQLPVAQAELDRANADLEKARRDAAILAGRLQDAQDEVAQVTAQLQAGVGKVDAARADIAQMAREQARGTDGVSALGLVTGAQSTEDFLEQYAVSSSAARSQARTLTALQDAEALARNQEARLAAIRVEIAQLKKAADDNVVVKKAAEAAATAKKAEVKGLIVKQTELKATIEAQKVQTLADIEATKQDLANQESEIKGLIEKQKARDAEIARQREAARKAAEEAAAAAAKSQGGGGSGGGGGGGSGSAGSFLDWPTASHVVTSSYGWRLSPTYGVWMLHAGADFRAGLGTPIRAAQSGEVDESSCSAGPGCNIRINHGSYDGQNVRTRYLHLAVEGRAAVGQWVQQGQVIGYSGGTGRITGPHLHFEVYVNGSSTDPVPWLPR
ncbi:M23 family metallopeptidase [Xylanimonas protaetiae]|uniref:Peptidase M23 n=1 Tax=Xylanimonas protaetiae TaxID=2509457 RepID=A0A4V0YG92_9MICO|nr:M23 family metallopeptidase [Xylanimonas protaetiae]QAY70401.1 peptidase M23 [Xylanimonas protaetiae]